MSSYVKTFFDETLAHKEKLSGKPYVAFGTHEGGARVLGSLEKLSVVIGLKPAAPGIMCQGAPGADDKEAGRCLDWTLAIAVAE